MASHYGFCLTGLVDVAWQVCSGHAVLNLGVGDGSVLLPKVQSQLTLVAKVQVAFLTMIGLFSGMYA